MHRPQLTAWASALLLASSLLACDTARAPSTPPRCEPPSELELERGLKQGFRAIAEGRDKEATGAFRGVLEDHGEHPEARAGLRLVLRNRRRSATHRTPTTSAGAIWLGEQALPVKFDVDTRTLRYEEEEARSALSESLGLEPTGERERPSIFTKRDVAEATGLDLVVLSASGGQTAREHLLKTRGAGRATHFLVDWDGQIYQTLDLALRAHHVGDEALDQRSVSIILVNPMAKDAPPLPASASGSSHVRPLSAPAAIHGELIQAWGYTASQERSLARLLQGLLGALPNLPRTVAMGLDVLPSDAHKGVLGQLHLDPTSKGPGPGLDWNSVRRALHPR